MSAESTQDKRQPWLHELAIATDGNATVLSGADGQLDGTGAHGLYVDDCRVVNRLVVTVGGEQVVSVGAASSGAISEFLGSARHLGHGGADPTVEVLRVRRLVGPELTETITVTSRAVEVETEVRIVASGDGAELASVKAGQGGTALPVTVTTDAATWATARHEVRVTVGGAPATMLPAADGGVEIVAGITVPAGGSRAVSVVVSSRRTTASLFDSDAGSGAVRWLDNLVVRGGDPRLARTVMQSVTDLAALLQRDPLDRGDIFAAAGTPWYLTLFGRDSLWTARLALPLGTELAVGTLRALARRQGVKDDPATAEAPGKIPHELRRTNFVDPSHGLHLPPVYYGTVDATALWVCLLHDAWRWGLGEDQIHDLLPALRAALGWLTGPALGADGLLKYVDTSGTGLANQGWKDSGDSMRFADGRIADAPIALVEAQAYAVEAARGAADLLDAIDPTRGESPALREYARALSERMRSRYWLSDAQNRFLAMALDGQDAAITGVGSNMGHALGTGALNPSEAADVVRALTSPRLLGRHGIRTLSTDNDGFNPLGYHTGSVWTHDSAICALGMSREGFGDEASAVALRLLDAAEAFDHRFPELYADTGVLGAPVPYPASCRPQAWSAASAVALLTIATGLQVDVPAGVVRVAPPAAMPFGPISLQGIRIGQAAVSIEITAERAVTVEGLPDGLRLETA